MNALSWIEVVYWAATIIGGTLFVLRTIMMLAGGIGHHDFDMHTDSDFDAHYDVHLDGGHDGMDHADVDHADGDPAGSEHPNSDFSFKLLTLQGLTAFFMMFGLVGLALLEASLPEFLTAVGGIAAGLFAVWVISLLFAQLRRFQSDGTLNIRNAMGQRGSVYLTIPANSTGQVQVPVQGTLRIFDAAANGDAPIKTGETICVVGVLNNNTLIVEKI